MYLKFFVSAMAVSILIAIILFLITARRASDESKEIRYLTLGKVMIILAIIFIIIVTPLSIDMADRRNPNPDAITYNGVNAVEGFKVAIDYNCMDCHTIVGNGAYYAPDLTLIARRAYNPENIRALLDTFVGSKYMPFNLTDREKDALTAWLLYLRDLNTNGWPPMPKVSLKPVTKTLEKGREIYLANCQACHGKDGRGVVPGTPDFTNATWWSEELEEEGGTQGLIKVILNGRGAMPGFKDRLSIENIKAVLAYVQSLASVQKPVKEYGGFSFEPSFEANISRWYESFEAWLVFWVVTVIFSTFIIYSFLYWYTKGGERHG